MPARPAELVVGDVVVVVGDPDVVVTVSVVILADGGTASVLWGDGLPSPPLEINSDASTAATPNNTITAAASTTWVLPNRLFRTGGAGGPGGAEA
jgi:hypothetical protein